jgi:membrane associated rhomboid family serine protease
MFFPIRTDRRLQHTPWLNVSLICANVAVFVVWQRADVRPYMLNPVEPRLFQYVSYQFLHDGWMHLAGNMLFLYVFGNSVEDRLGKFGYLCFYLAGGIIAGLGHGLVEQSPVLGASGSCAAVTGAYLALFPLSNVTLFYWFFFIGTFEVPSMLLILFNAGKDLVFQLGGAGQVAYLAHLSGYAFGFAIGMGLLWVRLLPREPYDLLSLIARQRRRAQFRSLTRSGYEPWSGKAPSSMTADGEPAEQTPDQQRALELREKLLESLRAQDRDAAVDHYASLLDLNPDQVMSQQHQLDLANHLMTRERYDLAARAYELFLGTFSSYAQKEQIELILALIYVRYLERGQRARELVHKALPRLREPEQKALAEQILQELG